jgi:hypothetical protein
MRIYKIILLTTSCLSISFRMEGSGFVLLGILHHEPKVGSKDT